MTRSAQRAAPGSRLQLLAAVLLGIVAMHTLGHPSESHALEDAAAAHGVAREHTVAAHQPIPAAHAVTAAHAAHPGPAVPPGPAAHAGPTLHPGPAVHTPGRPAMDPMSVCLAVLAGLVLLALGRALVRYEGDLATGGRGPDRVPRGPGTPGPRELLIRLAVLRV